MQADLVARSLVLTAKSEQFSARRREFEENEEREAAKVRSWLWSSTFASAFAANPFMRLSRNALKYLKKCLRV